MESDLRRAEVAKGQRAADPYILGGCLRGVVVLSRDSDRGCLARKLIALGRDVIPQIPELPERCGRQLEMQRVGRVMSDF